MSGEEPAEAEVPRWQRWTRTFMTAGRWVLDVLRGHARSRHLDHHNK